MSLKNYIQNIKLETCQTKNIYTFLSTRYDLKCISYYLKKSNILDDEYLETQNFLLYITKKNILNKQLFIRNVEKFYIDIKFDKFLYVFSYENKLQSKNNPFIFFEYLMNYIVDNDEIIYNNTLFPGDNIEDIISSIISSINSD